MQGSRATSGAPPTGGRSLTQLSCLIDGKHLIAGSTGYIGRLLSQELLGRALDVRCMARRPEGAADLASEGAEVVVADVLEPATLEPALEGVKVAYYLVHSMGRGAEGDEDFSERDRRAATSFGEAAREAGVEQLIYLGGLGEGRSKHLQSRHETALALQESRIPLTYFRAAAVLGAGSESFRTVLHLVRRLPVMVTPRWVTTRTQPIAIADVIAYLSAAPDVQGARGREVEIGGPDVTTYGGMLDEMARAMGRRSPHRIVVPVLTPWLSSLWIGLVTPVDPGVARPLIEGLSTETVVRDDSGMKLFDIEPTPLVEAMRVALDEVSQGER